MVVTDVAVSKRVLFSWKNVEEMLQIVLKSNCIIESFYVPQNETVSLDVIYMYSALKLHISTMRKEIVGYSHNFSESV